MTLRAALDEAIRQLDQGQAGAPRLTAEVLLAHALGQERSYLYAHDLEPCPDEVFSAFRDLVRERLAGRPTQYLTGRQEFYGRDFRVTPAVLIPRPETEHVVERALALAGDGQRLADVGCGSGAIGVTLALELRRRMVLTDLSAEALWMARENAAALGARCDFVQGDALSMLGTKSLDLIVSNPPYIPLTDAPILACEVRDAEPALALFGGESGNDVYARIMEEAPRVLRSGGWLVMELGWQSAAAVCAMAAAHFTQVEVGQDLAGHDRVFSARLK